jgi:hypothetical protein
MEGYLGEFNLPDSKNELLTFTPNDWALYWIESYGQIDGEHHKMAMTPDSFRAALEAVGLTVEGFAALTGQHRTTCQYWGRPRSGRAVQAFPRWVPLLLAAWAAHPEMLAQEMTAAS